MVHSLLRFVSRPCAFRAAAALLILAYPGAARLGAQPATVRVEENFRAAPDDVILGTLAPGTELRVVGGRGGWLEAELEGWVWIRSLQVTARDGHDLVVHPEEPAATHENLRARPGGAVLGRLVRGALLAEEERIPGWIRVRRRGWVWAASVDAPAGGPSAGATLADAADADGEPPELVRAGGSGLAVLGAPGGDTLARVGAGTDLELLDRQGSWVRVRLDGWAWIPDRVESPVVEDAAGERPTDGAASPAAVAADPARWRGRIVTWELEFISLERAEAVRTDFFAGEPFLLARGLGGAEDSFVYVALPPERLADGERLNPLERITVVGRVRVGASSLTGSPILDLVELRRGGPVRDSGGSQGW